ncbi:hypothetical protein D3C87_1487270 [compost metagenome]
MTFLIRGMAPGKWPEFRSFAKVALLECWCWVKVVIKRSEVKQSKENAVGFTAGSDSSANNLILSVSSWLRETSHGLNSISSDLIFKG